ncbi:hypothetical protein HELRODRAFT_179315 [Helobdella robusta]|uniref:Kringle domain-containing protein n=1 Tax=Helobdella robusta TaxID=6412 RepID=T1FEJ2_HELRO|nr:hypothetical protein HELRODRAFT_179315 [Helobdella robusta]ESN95539.1 hypothetical protein HELRODRAFT_179315 [Helobdella robusta]
MINVTFLNWLIILYLEIPVVSLSLPSCALPLNGALYWGTHNKTISGRPCLPWKLFEHKITSVMLPDLNLEVALNFCRNPGMVGGRPFCYIQSDPPVAEDCSVCSRHEETCVLMDRGVNYVGDTSVSLIGRQCVSWIDAFKFLNHTYDKTLVRTNKSYITQEFVKEVGTITLDRLTEFGNFCRNPVSTLHSPWCFVDVPTLSWNYCDVCFNGPSLSIANTPHQPLQNSYRTDDNNRYFGNFKTFKTNYKQQITESIYERNISSSQITRSSRLTSRLNRDKLQLISWMSLTVDSLETCAIFCSTTSTCVKFYFVSDQQPKCYYTSSLNENGNVKESLGKNCTADNNVPKVMKLINAECDGGDSYPVGNYSQCKYKCLNDVDCQAYQFMGSNPTYNCFTFFHFPMCRRSRMVNYFEKRTAHDRQNRNLKVFKSSTYVVIRCTNEIKRTKRNMPPSLPPNFDFFKYDLASTTEKPPPAGSDFDFADEYHAESRFQFTPKLASTIMYNILIIYGIVVVIILLNLFKWQFWFENPQLKYDLEVAGKT